jgi:hypothetical protein
MAGDAGPCSTSCAHQAQAHLHAIEGAPADKEHLHPRLAEAMRRSRVRAQPRSPAAALCVAAACLTLSACGNTTKHPTAAPSVSANAPPASTTRRIHKPAATKPAGAHTTAGLKRALSSYTACLTPTRGQTTLQARPHRLPARAPRSPTPSSQNAPPHRAHRPHPTPTDPRPHDRRPRALHHMRAPQRHHHLPPTPTRRRLQPHPRPHQPDQPPLPNRTNPLLPHPPSHHQPPAINTKHHPNQPRHPATAGRPQCERLRSNRQRPRPRDPRHDRRPRPGRLTVARIGPRPATTRASSSRVRPGAV